MMRHYYIPKLLGILLFFDHAWANAPQGDSSALSLTSTSSSVAYTCACAPSESAATCPSDIAETTAVSSSPPATSTTPSPATSTTPSSTSTNPSAASTAPSAASSSPSASPSLGIFLRASNWTQIQGGGKPDCDDNWSFFGGATYGAYDRGWWRHFDNEAFWSTTFSLKSFKEDGEWWAANTSDPDQAIVKAAKVDKTWRCYVVQVKPLNESRTIQYSNKAPYFAIDGTETDLVKYGCSEITTT